MSENLQIHEHKQNHEQKHEQKHEQIHEQIHEQQIPKQNHKSESVCMDLEAIKYKKMLLTGVPMKEPKYSNNLEILDNFLENEKINNESEPWCKLNNTVKLKKLLDFVKVYRLEHDMDEEEANCLITFFKDCLERKKLQKVKDVVYDKINGNIKSIPSLVYTKNTKHFTLKNLEKKAITLKYFASAPNKNSTIKNKHLEHFEHVEHET
jgi:hypothetical protein